MSNRLGLSKVCPLLYGVEFSEIAEPLRQFQAATFKKRDFLGLIHSINNSCGDNKLNSARLDLVFDIWWEHLYEEIKKVQSNSSDELGNVSNYANFDQTTDAKMGRNVNSFEVISVKRTLFEFISFFKTCDNYSFEDYSFIVSNFDKYSTNLLNVLSDYSEILPQYLINDFLSLITELRSVRNKLVLNIDMSEFPLKVSELIDKAGSIYENFDTYFA